MTAAADEVRKPDRGQVLGVLGGGQLGRMFVHAAQVLGYRTAVLDPDDGSPAGTVSHHHLCVDYDDGAGLAALAHLCAAITTEFENVPAQALDSLARSTRVAPGADALRICQHRAREKGYFRQAGVRCAPYAVIESESDLVNVDPALFPAVLKTATLGYDGKGQAAVATAQALPEAWAALGRAVCVLEQRLALQRELSVIVARADDGQIVHLPVQQNLHRDGVLAVTQVPAPDIPSGVAAEAIRAAEDLAHAMHYVGVLCVEFFWLADGSLVANEMAPRPHNSGHYSLDACDVSQFELQVRCLARLPLVAPRQHSAALMLNLLGDLWFPDPADSRPTTPPWPKILCLPGAHLHLYGKAEPRPGRKMGHLTLTAADPASVRATALQAAAVLGLPGF